MVTVHQLIISTGRIGLSSDRWLTNDVVRTKDNGTLKLIVILMKRFLSGQGPSKVEQLDVKK